MLKNKKMYIYNVTINVDDNILETWLQWVRPHILEVLKTGKFISAKFTQVLVEEEMGGTTFSIQYTAKTKEDIQAYYQQNADKLRQDSLRKFGNKCLTFRTEMKLIEDFYA